MKLGVKLLLPLVAAAIVGCGAADSPAPSTDGSSAGTTNSADAITFVSLKVPNMT